ncbi:MAG: Rpn family recombination-promoting nuclease/putative transposase [Candidatus Sericytochromatia bacterium]|nr:Rpn family recombination-promoting nuclease/putative transposase [Candidatus Sericytochromatia bacterium]
MIKKIHDHAYKKIFSNKTFFRQLLQSFVDMPWVKDIDFDSSETVNKSFISDDYKNTESDLIYKLKLKDKDIYVYILMEFQSSVDKFISVRMLNYITSLYIELIDFNKKSKKKLDKLPAVFPILLYNGDRDWIAATNTNQVIENNELLGEYGINYKYFKIIEKDYSLDSLLKIKNLVSTLFLSETNFDLELIKNEILNLLETEEDKQALSILINFFRLWTENKIIERSDYDNVEKLYNSKQEATEMIATSVKKLEKK